jgi:hypothetical protein
VGRETQALCCLRCGGRGHAATDCARSFAASDVARVACYVCGEFGHLCCASQDEAAGALASAGGGGGKRKSCCRCGGMGHVDADCAQRCVLSHTGPHTTASAW